jgi:hypothetical protein
VELYYSYPMRKEIDPRIAENIITTAVSRVWATPGEKIVCTRRILRDAIAAAIQNAYEIGLLAGQEADSCHTTQPGSADRPPWMDIRLEDKAAMAALQIRLWPIMVQSLHEGGYHLLGDLRWVPVEQLIQGSYIGRKTAHQIRDAMRTREWKMILSETRPPELYHLNGEYIERRNVAAAVESASVRRGLEQRLTGWWKW